MFELLLKYNVFLSTTQIVSHIIQRVERKQLKETYAE